MPKIKTHRGYKKRVKKVTKNGKVLHKHCGKSHFLAKRSSSRKRKLAVSKRTEGAEKKRILKVAPNLR